ncbi:hypothetical protein RJ639_039143 [Escallonia herrerae]|uniref:X8 domain-containing protein n=1 Tax=Escallonia herrerae TaxID=1293975 RepID=A0AA88WT51_9ASTE|nr:hypothetical protein RJ639_039143 [Escallonia herrerae]
MTRTILTIIWACLMVFEATNVAGAGLGVIWGRQQTQKLLPSMVVDLILANGVKKVRLLSYNSGVIAPFFNSDIDIVMTIANNDFFQTNTKNSARDFIQRNITSIMDNGTNKGIRFTSICIGNEPFSLQENMEQNYLPQLFPAFENIIDAVFEQQIGDKVNITIPHFTDILKPNITKPSEGEFHPDYRIPILRNLALLKKVGSPFMINLYPLLHLRQYGYPLEFGFFEDRKNFTIKDGEHVYTNVFDAVYDTVISAIRREGYSLDVIVGQVGWPTAGDEWASPETAERFYDGFLMKMAMNKGTPLHPEPLEAYIYSLVDENSRNISRSTMDRHYGIYNYDGTAKFKIDLTLKGRKNVIMANATGIDYMPRRWCVFNPEMRLDANSERLMRFYERACTKGDCSKLRYGEACNKLDLMGNYSYAFNQYFQSKNQNESECNFDGYAMIVSKDPSTKECVFPLQILSTLFDRQYGEMLLTLGYAGESFNIKPAMTTFIAAFLCILYTIF